MPNTRNPWIREHTASEMLHTGGEYRPSDAFAIVQGEYAGRQPKPCECGEQAHYKATIGAYKCPSCGALYRGNGRRVG